MSEILVFMSIMFGLFFLVIYAIYYVLAYKIGEIKEKIEKKTILLTRENIDEFERILRAEVINIFAERLMKEKGEPDENFYWWVSFEGIRSLAEEMVGDNRG